MSQNTKFFLKISADDEAFIYEAREVFVNSGGQAGAVYHEFPTGDFKFDPTNAAFTMYALLGVLATIGGAIQFLEWVIGKAKIFKSENSERIIVVICNDKTIVISKDSDIQALCVYLKKQLEIESENIDV